MNRFFNLDHSLSQQKMHDLISSVPLNKLTSYIQQLRSFLPEATLVGEQVGYVYDDYVITFLEKALVIDWDKLNPKVSSM